MHQLPKRGQHNTLAKHWRKPQQLREQLANTVNPGSQDLAAVYVSCLGGARSGLAKWATYHMVGAEKVFGIIFDPGAASALMGCDALIDYHKNVLWPNGREDWTHITAPRKSFIGIDGVSSNSPGLNVVPLGLGPVDINWPVDLQGGHGGHTPGLWSNQQCLTYKCSVYWKFFENSDGLLVMKVEGKTIGVRLYKTTSGHYLIRADQFHDRNTSAKYQYEARGIQRPAHKKEIEEAVLFEMMKDSKRFDAPSYSYFQYCEFGLQFLKKWSDGTDAAIKKKMVDEDSYVHHTLLHQHKLDAEDIQLFSNNDPSKVVQRDIQEYPERSSRMRSRRSGYHRDNW